MIQIGGFSASLFVSLPQSVTLIDKTFIIFLWATGEAPSSSSRVHHDHSFFPWCWQNLKYLNSTISSMDVLTSGFTTYSVSSRNLALSSTRSPWSCYWAQTSLPSTFVLMGGRFEYETGTSNPLLFLHQNFRLGVYLHF